MALRKREADVVAEIAKKYGQTIDLKGSPAVIVEILRTYGKVLDPPAGGGGAGGVSPNPDPKISTIAVGITPPKKDGEVRLDDVMRAVLQLQRDFKTISQKLSPAK